MKVRTILKYDTILKLQVSEWMELLQTIQSLSKKIEKDKSKSGEQEQFAAFKLEAGNVKRMIELAKTAASRAADQEPDGGEEYNVYGNPYGNPAQDAQRVSRMFEVRKDLQIKFSVTLNLDLEIALSFFDIRISIGRRY